MSIRIGLGIGRLVFRALNRVEAAFAVALIAVVVVGSPPVSVAVLLLAVQLAAIRPGLGRRSDRVLAGEELPHSRAHLW